MRGALPAPGHLCVIGVVLGLIPQGCEDKEQEEEGVTPQARFVEEGALSLLVLSEAQERSLGVRLEVVETRRVAQELELVGWVEARPGAAVEIRAQASGWLLAAGPWPAPGARVGGEQLLARLRPVLLPPDQLQVLALLGELQREAAEIGRDMGRARAALETARAQLERAKGLLAETAGSKKALEEARFQEAAATADVKAAEERTRALEEKRHGISSRFEGTGSNGGPASESGSLAPLEVKSPLGGVLTAVRAAPGELVEAGRTLFEAANLETIWIRVPVFEADLARVDASAPLRFAAPGLPASTQHEAKPVSRAPAVDPQRRSSDLYFECPNPDGRLLKGQSVAVRVATGQSREAVLAPASSLVFDSRGGAWAYVARGDRKYQRRRVETGSWFGQQVEVRRGLAPGEKVVAAGASELFGSEFGAAGE